MSIAPPKRAVAKKTKKAPASRPVLCAEADVEDSIRRRRGCLVKACLLPRNFEVFDDVKEVGLISERRRRRLRDFWERSGAFAGQRMKPKRPCAVEELRIRGAPVSALHTTLRALQETRRANGATCRRAPCVGQAGAGNVKLETLGPNLRPRAARGARYLGRMMVTRKRRDALERAMRPRGRRHPIR